MQKGRRDQVHDQRLPLLQPGFSQQRRGRRGHREGQRQRSQHPVDSHEPQLGAELAIQRRPRRPGLVLPSHGQRPPLLHLMERGASSLAVRPDFHGQELPRLKIKKFQFSRLLFFSFFSGKSEGKWAISNSRRKRVIGLEKWGCGNFS